MKLRLYLMSLTAIFLLVCLLGACSLPLAGSSNQVPDAAFTAAAETVDVLRTQFAATPPVTSATPGTPSTTQTASITPSSPSTASCDRAALIAETIPDDTPIAGGTAFTKTWTLKNTGGCTWNSSYSLVFVKGNAMGGESQPLPFASVAPGEIIQLSVNLVAPQAGSTVRGEWMLRNASGVLFGLGPKGDQTFWVQIKISN